MKTITSPFTPCLYARCCHCPNRENCYIYETAMSQLIAEPTFKGRELHALLLTLSIKKKEQQGGCLTCHETNATGIR